MATKSEHLELGQREKSILILTFLSGHNIDRFDSFFLYISFCCILLDMGQWKAPLSLRVRQELRLQLEEAAAKERRTLSNFSELLLEWACEQLKVAGTIDRLFELRPATSRKKTGLQ